MMSAAYKRALIGLLKLESDAWVSRCLLGDFVDESWQVKYNMSPTRFGDDFSLSAQLVNQLLFRGAYNF